MRVETISLHDYFGTWHENLRVCVNPRDLEELARALRIDLSLPDSFYRALRALVEPNTGDAYIWCAGKGTHDAVAEQLGFDQKGCYYQNITKTDSGWTAQWMAGSNTDHMSLETMFQCEKKIASIFEIDIDERYSFGGEHLIEPESVEDQPITEEVAQEPAATEVADSEQQRIKDKYSSNSGSNLPDLEYTPEKWAEAVEFFKEERGKFYYGCIFKDCLHTIAAKFLGTYREHQYETCHSADCQGCYMAHFR